MLIFCVTITLCIAMTKANGEFSVLFSPHAVSFKGDKAIDSEYVGHILYAAMGNAITSDSVWSGMKINNPFKLPKNMIAIYVESVGDVTTHANTKNYKITGNNAIDSLNSLSLQLKEKNELFCDIDFINYERGVTAFNSCFGDNIIIEDNKSKYLNPFLHTGDKLLFQTMARINFAANSLKKFKEPVNLIFRLSTKNVEKSHGVDSEAVQESKKMISDAVKLLLIAARKSTDSLLFVQITNNVTHERVKRSLKASELGIEYKLADPHNEDYPAIFNIILWFVVIFAASLLAICYAIASMDPGRDSIIYRMTSTRIKKDN